MAALRPDNGEYAGAQGIFLTYTVKPFVNRKGLLGGG